MNQDSKSIPRSVKQKKTTSKSGSLRRMIAKQSPNDICRGLVFLALAYLLGQCTLYFDTRPLGVAFLCAGSSYVWYILVGLSLAAILSPGALPFGAYLGVYALVIVLRLVLLYLVDKQPPVAQTASASKSDRLGVRRNLDTLLEHWRAFRRLLPHPKGTRDLYEDASEYYAASCSMLHNPPTCPPQDPLPTKERTRVVGVTDDNRSTKAALFGENIFLRLLTACIAGFALGLCGMVLGGFQVYDLLGTLVLLPSLPLIVFLMIPVFSNEGKRLLFADGFSKPRSRERRMPLRTIERPTYTAFSTIAVVMLLSVSVYAARSLSFSFGNGYFGLYAAPAIALLLSLVAARHLGVIASVIVALFVGVAAEPMLVPAFLLAVLAYALLRLASRRIAVWGGYVAAIFWCYLSGGLTGLAQLSPSFLLGLTVFFASEKVREAFPLSRTAVPSGLSDFAISMANRLRHEATQRRMSNLSDAFSSLSDWFYDLSGQLRHPRETDYRRVCQSVFEENCAACRRRKECLGQAGACTRAAKDTMVHRLSRHGHVTLDQLPPTFREFCPCAATIVQQLNASCAHMTEVMLRSEKTEVFAADYEAIATILDMTARADAEEYQFHKENADRVLDYFSKQGVSVQGVVVCGNRKRHITVRGRNFDRARKKITEIKKELEKMFGLRLDEPIFRHEDEYTVMSVSSLPRMATTYSGSTVPADMDKDSPFPAALTQDTERTRYTPPDPCGDHIAIFTNEQAYFYALISDGMGSGSEASFTSDICAIFLEKMLSAGSPAEVSVKMLNNFIRSKNVGSGDECSATVDLMELDLCNGHAIFVKSGAAPTYVVRAGTVYKLHSRTVPIGIFKDSEPQLLRFRMHPGDVIVMVSDGVTHGNDECPWLIDLLSDPLPNNMDSLRLDILTRAVTSGSPDDLSAIAVRVEDAQETK